MKWLTFTFLTFVLILLLWATSDLPSRANPQSPANVHLSPEFTKLTETEIHVPNIVSAILIESVVLKICSSFSFVARVPLPESV